LVKIAIMDKTKILAYRCIIPGALFTLAGPVMLAIPEMRPAAWGVIVAGPGLILLGLYILKRHGST
jgi:hypothetical protein